MFPGGHISGGRPITSDPTSDLYFHGGVKKEILKRHGSEHITPGGDGQNMPRHPLNSRDINVMATQDSDNRRCSTTSTVNRMLTRDPSFHEVTQLANRQHLTPRGDPTFNIAAHYTPRSADGDTRDLHLKSSDFDRADFAPLDLSSPERSAANIHSSLQFKPTSEGGMISSGGSGRVGDSMFSANCVSVNVAASVPGSEGGGVVFGSSNVAASVPRSEVGDAVGGTSNPAASVLGYKGSGVVDGSSDVAASVPGSEGGKVVGGSSNPAASVLGYKGSGVVDGSSDVAASVPGSEGGKVVGGSSKPAVSVLGYKGSGVVDGSSNVAGSASSSASVCVSNEDTVSSSGVSSNVAASVLTGLHSGASGGQIVDVGADGTRHRQEGVSRLTAKSTISGADEKRKDVDEENNEAKDREVSQLIGLDVDGLDVDGGEADADSESEESSEEEEDNNNVGQVPPSSSNKISQMKKSSKRGSSRRKYVRAQVERYPRSDTGWATRMSRIYELTRSTNARTGNIETRVHNLESQSRGNDRFVEYVAKVCQFLVAEKEQEMIEAGQDVSNVPKLALSLLHPRLDEEQKINLLPPMTLPLHSIDEIRRCSQKCSDDGLFAKRLIEYLAAQLPTKESIQKTTVAIVVKLFDREVRRKFCWSGSGDLRVSTKIETAGQARKRKNKQPTPGSGTCDREAFLELDKRQGILKVFYAIVDNLVPVDMQNAELLRLAQDDHVAKAKPGMRAARMSEMANVRPWFMRDAVNKFIRDKLVREPQRGPEYCVLRKQQQEAKKTQDKSKKLCGKPDSSRQPQSVPASRRNSSSNNGDLNLFSVDDRGNIRTPEPGSRSDELPPRLVADWDGTGTSNVNGD